MHVPLPLSSPAARFPFLMFGDRSSCSKYAPLSSPPIAPRPKHTPLPLGLSFPSFPTQPHHQHFDPQGLIHFEYLGLLWPHKWWIFLSIRNLVSHIQYPHKHHEKLKHAVHSAKSDAPDISTTNIIRQSLGYKWDYSHTLVDGKFEFQECATPIVV